MGVCSAVFLAVITVVVLGFEFQILAGMQPIPTSPPPPPTTTPCPDIPPLSLEDLLSIGEARVFRYTQKDVWKRDCTAFMRAVRGAQRAPKAPPEPEPGAEGSKGATMDKAHTPPDLAAPVLMHTGLTEFGGAKGLEVVDFPRKVRLGVMSFLASQELGKIRLLVWCAPLGEAEVREVLAPIIQDDRYARHVTVAPFDAQAEFEHMTTPAQAELLFRIYNGSGNIQKASASDLMRIALLHNYGGMWIDTDVLLVNSFLPLAGLDWVYEGQPDFYNPALLSVSEPRSAFMKAVLRIIGEMNLTRIGERGGFVYTFGPSLMRRIVKHNRNITHLVVTLPSCFFDPGFQGTAVDWVSWSNFWTTTAEDKHVAYLTPGKGPPFAYHWHGRWNHSIANNSLPDRMERLYLQRLQLQG